MYNNAERYKSFSRRTALLAGGKLLLTGLLVSRMYQLQVVESGKYRTLAEDNRINLQLLPPLRGRILDRYGHPVAVNREDYKVILVAEQVEDVEATLAALARLIRLDDGERRRILRGVRRRRGFVPVTVRENLKWEDVSRIEVNAPDLPGISIEVGQSRQYPYGEDFAHVLGYVAAVSKGETGDDPLLSLPGFKIGKAGIERAFDTGLRGGAGNRQVEVNAMGRVIRELSRREGQTGKDVRLTLDRDLQIEAVNLLRRQKSAAAVIMDVETGDVLVLASVPGFDPNAFVTGLSSREWARLSGDPLSPLSDKAIAGQFSPGSTFKMIVALAALEAGIIDPDHRVRCAGHVQLGNRRFHCWKKHGHGRQDMIGALQHSCDVYFYKLAERTGIDRIAEMSERFGLGSKTEIGLPGEKDGLVPTRAWKRATRGVSWQRGDTYNAGIGQGFLTATPLQLAVMSARLANGRVAVTPRLSGTGNPVFEPLGISDGGLEVVREGMYRVCNLRGGTAYKARIPEEGFEMSGKTGTVQVRRISKRERLSGVLKNEELPWNRRDHALFVGFAPSHRPRYAAAVVVMHGGSGSGVAAPIVRDLLSAVQRKEITPGSEA